MYFKCSRSSIHSNRVFGEGIIPDCKPGDLKRLLFRRTYPMIGFVPTSKGEAFPSVFVSEAASALVFDTDGLPPSGSGVVSSRL